MGSLVGHWARKLARILKNERPGLKGQTAFSYTYYIFTLRITTNFKILTFLHDGAPLLKGGHNENNAGHQNGDEMVLRENHR